MMQQQNNRIMHNNPSNSMMKSSESSSSPSSSSPPSWQPPATSPSPQRNNNALIDSSNQPMRNYDGTYMHDAQSRLVYKSQFLSTHPLRGDCKERVGYGGRKFTYVSGDGVIRTMNAVFGFGGWSSQITMERVVQCEKDDRGRWIIGYLATVRVTLRNGVSHEDCGSGDGINESKVKAHEKAMKSAVTDAMKRAARHFGERLGNALYVKGSGMKTAPRTNKDALLELERKDALNLFGDQALLRANSTLQCQSPPSVKYPSSVAGNAGDTTLMMQKENLPQNRSDLTPVASSSAPRPPTMAAMGAHPVSACHSRAPLPSSSAILHGPLQVQVAKPGALGNTNPSSSVWNHVPNPPTLMPPPPRPMYNPGGGSYASGSTFNGAQHTNMVNGNHAAATNASDSTKRGRSSPHGIENGSKNNNISSNSSANNNSNTNNNDDNNKRQKKNPYSRLSV